MIPQFLIDMLNNQYGEKITEKIMQGYSVKRYTTLRVNTIKSDISKVKLELDKNDIEYENVKWSEDVLILKNATEKQIEKMEIYINGEIYLQSLSSILPPIILEPKPNEDILDMAAAPGGKTTQLAAISQNLAHITACEMNSIRAERLKYNIEKQGANAYVMVTDSRRIDDFFSFDKILLDSPCSGSGTLNINNSDLEKNFTKKLIDKSTKSQIQLLRKAIQILKPGHEMVYSTCSVLKCENEDIINQVLKENKIEIVKIEFEGMDKLPILPTKIPGTLCIMPNEFYEGFFVAKIRKV